MPAISTPRDFPTLARVPPSPPRQVRDSGRTPRIPRRCAAQHPPAASRRCAPSPPASLCPPSSDPQRPARAPASAEPWDSHRLPPRAGAGHAQRPAGLHPRARASAASREDVRAPSRQDQARAETRGGVSGCFLLRVQFRGLEEGRRYFLNVSPEARRPEPSSPNPGVLTSPCLHGERLAWACPGRPSAAICFSPLTKSLSHGL